MFGTVTTTSSTLATILGKDQFSEIIANRKGKENDETANAIITNNGSATIFLDLRNDDNAVITVNETPLAAWSTYEIEKYLLNHLHLIGTESTAISVIG